MYYVIGIWNAAAPTPCRKSIQKGWMGNCAHLPQGFSPTLCLAIVIMWRFVESLCFN